MEIKVAMLLAAGRGQRLVPLTDTTPKPLLQVGDQPLIGHHLVRLKNLGIEKVIINVSYLAKQIIDALGDGKKFGLSIEYSYEPQPLGAGGGIRQALPLLGDEPFLIISSDIYSDFPLEKFFAKDWSLQNNLIHSVLTDKTSEHGDFDLIDGYLRLAENPEYIYGSIAIIHPEVFKHETQGFSGIMPAFSKVITENKATGEYYKNVLNINTLDDYKKILAIEAARKS